MAILFEDKYHKIIKTTNNFIDNTTEIEMNVYASEEAREHEKKIEQRIEIFKGNVYNLLEQNMINLIEKTNKIKPVNEIDDAEEFFKEHPEIEKEYKIVQAKQDEGLDIADKITTIDIDINKLQFKDLWIENLFTRFHESILNKEKKRSETNSYCIYLLQSYYEILSIMN